MSMDSLQRSEEVDTNIPRIKYHVSQSGRAFERLLKEHSFSELRDAIRTKLDIDPSMHLRMYRVQDGVNYDLEDEDDFAAMKSAAYASDTFDVHIAFQRRVFSKPSSRRSRRVSIVLPEKEAASVREMSQESSQPVIDNKTPEVETSPPPPPKKARGKSVSAGDSTTAGPSILKRKSSDSSKDASGDKGPPAKKHKPEKPSKENDDTSKVSSQPQSTTVPVKRKSSSNKLQKANSPPESSESSETSNIDSQKSANVDIPPSKKSKTKRDAESISAPKPVAKAVKPASKAAKSSVDTGSLPPILNYAQLKSMIASRAKSKGDEEDTPSTESSTKEKESKTKKKKQSEALDQTKNVSTASSDPSSRVNGKEKEKKKTDGGDVSKKSKKSASADGPKDQAKEKKSSTDAAKDKTKDKKTVAQAPIAPSSKSSADLTAANKGSKERSDVPSASSKEQPKSIDTIVTEIVASLDKSNTASKNDKKNPPSHTETSQLDPQRKSNVPVLPPKSRLSQVVMQSNDEGSESESESSSSSSGSNSDGEDVVPNRKSSLAKTTPSLESESTRQSANLDAVDLAALVRGPSVKSVVASLSKIVEEGEGDVGALNEEEKGEESGELVEEEEEEVVGIKHSIIPEAARRLSAIKGRAVDDIDDDDDYDDDDESKSSVSVSPSSVNAAPMKAVIRESTGNGRDVANTKDKSINEESLPRSTAPAPDNNPSPTEATSVSSEYGTTIVQPVSENTPKTTEGNPSSSNSDKPSDNSGTATIETNLSAGQRPSTPPADDSRPHTPTPTIPAKPLTPIVIQATPKTPRTVQRMKDRRGNLSVENTPLAVSTTANEDSAQATVRPIRFMESRARPTLDTAEPRPKPSLKRRARQSSLVPVLEKRVLRSSKMPPSSSSSTTVKLREPVQPAGSESEQDKEDTATVAPRNIMGGSQQSILGSQWQVLPSLPTTTPSPSPVDELQSNATNLDDGIKGPGSNSMRSAFRKHDESRVKRLVGSTETPNLNPHPDQPRSPLFLPGASQLSPSQFRAELMELDEDLPPSSLQASKPVGVDARSQTETEPESDKELAMPPPSQPLKSIFPSLSELSFSKFRPSFLMKNPSQSQSQSRPQINQYTSSKAATKADESDSDSDDDDSDDGDDSSEPEKRSHIPKNKRAGSGVVKRSKSRGLLR